MAGHHNHNAGTTYKCVDSNPERLLGDQIKNERYLVYLEAKICGSMKCPPNVNGKEMVSLCSVFSKKNIIKILYVSVIMLLC